MCFGLLWSYFSHNSLIGYWYTCWYFVLGNEEYGIVPDSILFPTPCASRTISFSNEFTQMDLVGPLIILLYYSDDPVVGSMTTFAWCCPCKFVASTATCCDICSTLVTCDLVLYRCVAHRRSYLFPVYWPRRCCFTSSLDFLEYFSLLLLMMDLSGLDWEISALCS